MSDTEEVGDIKSMFFIPQDFNKSDNAESDTKEVIELDRECILEDFMELPSVELW